MTIISLHNILTDFMSCKMVTKYTFKNYIMSSSGSFSDSSDHSELSHTRANLMQEQQQLKNEIRTAKTQVQRYEHDLEIAQNAYNIGQIAFLQRAKKLAALFGGAIRSDDELIEKVQKLKQEADDYEQKAKQLRIELDNYENTKTQTATLIQTHQDELNRQKDILTKKQGELAKAQELHDAATKDLNYMQQKTTDLINSLMPIAVKIGCKDINDEFFRTLETRLESYNPEFDKPLRKIAKAANVSYNGLKNFNPDQFFDKVVENANNLQSKIDAENKSQQTVIKKISDLEQQIKQKENETQLMIQQIEKLDQELENRRKQHEQKESEEITRIQKKIEASQEKELNHIRRVLEKIGASKLINDRTSLDDAVDIQCSVIIKLARKVQERKHAVLIRDTSAHDKLQKNVHVIEDVADTIIRSNRILLKKFK